MDSSSGDFESHASVLSDRGRRGIFQRPPTTFALDPHAIERILADTGNPLNRIAQTIQDGARVLDIGAGNGILPRLLSALGRSAVLDAVEPDPAARQIAGSLYREMFPGDIEAFLRTVSNRAERYDYVVLADVVEHLADPEPVLVELKSLLAAGGCIAVSTPNIAFASVRLALLEGRFDYVDSGIIERTHLRFYTLLTLQQLFAATGLYPIAEYRCLRDPMVSEIPIGGTSLLPWLLSRIAHDKLASVYQFLFFLSPEPRAIETRADLGSKGPSLPAAYILQRFRAFLAWLRRHTPRSPSPR